MKRFNQWLEEANKEKEGKLVAMRKWIWNQEHGHDHQKGAPAPVSKGDPDFEWIIKKATRLGGLDPYRKLDT